MSLSPIIRPIHGSGRVGSVLDPTQTQPAGVKWRAEELDRQNLSIESVLGEGEHRLVGRLPGSTKTSLEYAKTSLKSAKMLLESTFFL